MLINSQTKISALLKHHPAALEAIITLSPDFKKLRNPFLRKLMAARTTILMASKIGGCRPEDFFEKLKPYGFEVDTLAVSVADVAEQAHKSVPPFIKNFASTSVFSLDVRSILAEGKDPLSLIQQQVKNLQQGQVLKIINTFEPTPLVKLLEKQGFHSYVNTIDQDLVETYFYKSNPIGEVQLEAQLDGKDDWDQILTKYGDHILQIDVRHLEMPMPMMSILEALETIAADTALYVYHKRIPVFLLTELKERDFDYRIKEVKDGEVYLLIFKN